MTSKPSSLTHSQPTSTPTPSPNPTFVSAYSPHIRSQLLFPTEGRTKQSFKDECDINTIMKRFALTGQLTHLNERTPTFGDMEEIDFHTSMNIVAEARERFAALPSAIRDRFSNDPAKLLAFVQDVNNRDEAIRLGLVNKPQAPATPSPTPSPVSPTETPPPTPPKPS